MSRCGHALKVPIRKARVHVTSEFERTGSIIAGTASSRALGVRVRLELESEASSETIRELARRAEATCYTMAALRDPVPVSSTYVLNGEGITLT